MEQESIRIVEIQISAAFIAKFSENVEERKIDTENPSAICGLNLPTSGCRTRWGNPTYRGWPLALENINTPTAKEWKANFQVPVFCQITD